MSRWLKRSLSLLMTLVMVVGVLPTGITARAEEVDAQKDLNNAQGIIWLTKNKAGDNVSSEFSSMVQNEYLLDEMVREALGITNEKTKVYFEGVDIGSPLELLRNQDKIEALVDQMKQAVTDKYLIEFTVGGEKQLIAFRSLEGVQVNAGEGNKIYIDHAGAPEDADALSALVAEKLKKTTVSVTHTGTVTTTGFLAKDAEANKARYEATELVLDRGQNYGDLLNKWPTISASPDSNVKKAGALTVTIYAAEYDKAAEDKKDNFKQTVTVEVYLRDVRQDITINAVAYDGNGQKVEDAEVDKYLDTYQAYGADVSVARQPELDHYEFAGWAENATEGATFTAIMKAKTDGNGNGKADQNEEFTVTYVVSDGDNIAVQETYTVPYGDATPEGTKPVAGEGQKYIWREYDAEKKEAFGTWQAKVYSDVTYIAVLLEGPTVTGTLKVRDRVDEPVELFTYLKQYNTEDGYLVEDPVWDAYAMDGYECTGWYYIVAEGTSGAEDLNKDGIVAEMPFRMDTDVLYTSQTSDVQLYYEFFTMNNDTDFADGTEHNPLYIYDFVKTVQIDGENKDVIIKTLELNEPIGANYEGSLPEYGDLGRYQEFMGWKYAQAEDSDPNDYINYYTARANLLEIENKVSETNVGFDSLNSMYPDGPKKTPEGERVYYTWGDTNGTYYQAYVEISGMTYEVDADNNMTSFNYLYDESTEITVSPIWQINGKQKTMLCYVDDVQVNGGSIVTGYDSDYNAYGKGTAINQNQRSSTSNVALDIGYEFVNFKAKTEIGALPAGQDSYAKSNVYSAVMNSGAPDYDAVAEGEMNMRYLARKSEEVTIDLYKLYELFDAEGLGVVIEKAGETAEELPTEYPITLSEKWLDFSEMPEELTAQEVTDAYLADAFAKQKEEKFANIEAFIESFVPELTKKLDAEVLHPFGHVEVGVTDPTEQVKITYTNEKYSATVEAIVPIEDGRTATYFEVVNNTISARYQDSVGEKVLGNVTLKAADGTVLSGTDGIVVVTRDGDKVRDYADAGVGVYENVVVAFEGNDEYKPAVSEAFTLTVEKLMPTVTVKELIAELKGTDYYDQAEAVVEPSAPIVQVVAGVSADEFKVDKFEIDTDLNVDVDLADNTIVVDAWIKLPASYVELLDGLELGTFDGVIDGVEIPDATITAGAWLPEVDVRDALLNYTGENSKQDSSQPAEDQANQIVNILNTIDNEVLSRLGIEGLDYKLRIRLDALEDKAYPTDPGFYVNYAATLSTFTEMSGSEDKNYGTAEDYGFIVISPMVPIPNRGGVQLYDGEISNAQNVFVYEYSEELIERKLEVAINGTKQEGETPFYYGLTTRFEEVTKAPSKPGVYVAGYNYTTEVLNEDTGEKEVRRLGSDSAIIIIKQKEADLEIKGGTYEYDGENHIAEIIITDADGEVIKDSGVTVISGTVNANTESTNVTADDLYGTVNVDFPDALQNKWDEYCNRIWGEDAKDKFAPSDVISFLEECADVAEAAANKAVEEFKALAINDTVSKALDKINGAQDKVDVGSDNLVAKAERVQDLMQGGRAYYDRLIEQLEPLKDYDNNVWVTFYDLAEEADMLDYSKTGAYLYLGVITDPDLTVGVGKGLVIIHSEDDYIMYDTHVPYNGEPHNIFIDDDTDRGDVTVTVDREAKEISFFLDGDVFGAINAALEKVLGAAINEGSDVYVGTVYNKGENKIEEITAAIVEQIETKAIDRIKNRYPEQGAELEEALVKVKDKVLDLTDRVSDRLQSMDKMPNDTRIIVYEKSDETDLKGMPIDVGTYEFYGFDYDVAATRGNLIIEPIYILVEDEDASKYYGEEDPELTATVTYYSYEGVEDGVDTVEQMTIETLPEGVTEEDLVKYSVTRTEGEDVGKYDMTVEADLLEESGNYVLASREEDTEDFEILPVEVTITAVAEPTEIVVGDNATLTITVKDSKGNELDVDTTYVINDDATLTWDTAIATVGEYVITPELAEDVINYVVKESGVKQATLIVKEETGTIPSLTSRVTIDGSSSKTVVLGTLKAEDVVLDVKFSDNLGSDPEMLKEYYFSHYDYQTSSGVSLTDVNGDGVVNLDDALANVGTYKIVAVYKEVENPLHAYGDDKQPAWLYVESAEGKITLRVKVDHYSFVGSSVENVENYINPRLEVTADGSTLSETDELYKQLEPSFYLVDSNGSTVENIEGIKDNPGTYYFAFKYKLVDGYEIKEYTTALTVKENRLTVGVKVYKNDVIVNKVAVGEDADNYEIRTYASDELGTSGLNEKYVNGYRIYDSANKEVELQEALNTLGRYTIVPVLINDPESDYGIEPKIVKWTLEVSQKEVYVYPIIYYTSETVNKAEYTFPTIAYKHKATLSTGYSINPASYWECSAEEKQYLQNNITAVVSCTPEIDMNNVSDILNHEGKYIFKANVSMSDDFDTDVYKIIVGTKTLEVKKIGAQAKIRPKANSTIFTTVSEEDATYSMFAGNTAEAILAALDLSVTDDDGNVASSDLITGLKVTKVDTASVMLLSSIENNMLEELAKLEEPGTYLVETVSDSYGDYSEIRSDSITVIVKDVVGTIGLGDWKMDLDSVVYLNYYPVIEGFEGFDFSEKSRAGVVIWTGETAPTSRDDLMVGKENTTVIQGWRYNEEEQKWFVRTHEIYAKNLGDMVYIRPYVVDGAGEYVYLNGAPYYSPQLFAYDIMNTLNWDDDEQNVCAALLQYGASAQEYFEYEVENLVTTIPEKFVNVKWEDYETVIEYKDEYKSDIVLDEKVKSLATTLADNGELNKQGVEYDSSVLDLAGAIRFSTGFNIKTDVIDLDKIVKAEVLFWNERDFAGIDSLEYKYHNYNFKYDLVKATGEETVDIGDYRAQSDYIVAKYLGESVYFTCRIEMEDGTVYNSGLAYYSPETFAGDHIANSTGKVVDVSKRIIVYSEMAKRCFLENE